MAGLLEGIRVLDFTRFLAGPMCTRILADLGAEVLKIEPPPAGDFARQMHKLEETRGVGPMFLYTSAGKKSLCIDLKKPEGIEIVKELARKVDVVVENFAPGVMDRLGIGYQSLRRINHSPLMASISGFGQFGPWSQYTSYDLMGQALSGIMHVTGDPDGPPQYVGNNIGDPTAGLHAALAICGSLFYRTRSGQGQYIDISQVDALFWIDLFNISVCVLSNGAIRPRRFGNHHYGFAPVGVFRARDGWVAIHVFDQHWRHFLKSINREDLLDNPKFSTNADRVKNRNELIDIIENWLNSFDTKQAAIDVLHAARIPCAPVLDIHEAIHHPQIQAREMMTEVEHPVLGRYSVVQTPFHLSETPRRVQGPAPLLGEHNQQILYSYLGFSEEKIAALTRNGVLIRERLP